MRVECDRPAVDGEPWPPAPELEVVQSVLSRGENSALTVSTLLQGEYGLTDVCLSVPTIVNRNGADRLICPELSAEDLKALVASAEAIREVQKNVGLT